MCRGHSCCFRSWLEITFALWGTSRIYCKISSPRNSCLLTLKSCYCKRISMGYTLTIELFSSFIKTNWFHLLILSWLSNVIEVHVHWIKPLSGFVENTFCLSLNWCCNYWMIEFKGIWSLNSCSVILVLSWGEIQAFYGVPLGWLLSAFWSGFWTICACSSQGFLQCTNLIFDS